MMRRFLESLVLIGLLATKLPASDLFLVWAHGQDSTNEVYHFSVEGPASPATLVSTIASPNLADPSFVTFDSDGRMFVANRAISSGTPSLAISSSPLVSSPVFDSVYTDSTFHYPHGLAFWNGNLFVVQTSVSGSPSDPGSLSRYSVQSGQPPVLIGSIPNLTGRVRGVAVHPVSGEVFVTQCCGTNRIDRYIFDSSGSPVAHGSISGGLSNPHGMTFSASGELFVANSDAGNVLRFKFDSSGNAIPNGSIGGNNGAIDVAMSPWGELFVSSHSNPIVYRWIFDSAGNASSNGSFNTPHTLAGLAFDPAGQYKVCLLYDSSKAVRSGATLPVKLQLCDSAGNNLSSPSLTIHATGIIQVSSSISGQVEDSGNANPDNDFRFDAALGSTGGYIFNLKTTDLTTGSYKLKFTVSGDSFPYSAPFQVK